MWALVTGKSYSDFQFSTGPLVNWATRLMGSATPVVVDLLIILFATGVALLVMNHLDPVRKLARQRKRDLRRRR